MCIFYFTLVKIPSYLFEEMLQKVPIDVSENIPTDLTITEEKNNEIPPSTVVATLVSLPEANNKTAEKHPETPSTQVATPFPKKTNKIESLTNKILIPDRNLCIKKDVGLQSKNDIEDVLLIQKLLNEKGYTLEENGLISEHLIEAIAHYQKNHMKATPCDGKINEGGRTMFHLLAGRNPSYVEIILFRIEQLDEYVQAASQKYEIDPHIIKAIAYHETGGDATLGLMKVLPIAWEQINRDFPDLKDLDYKTYHTNAQINITFGAATLRNLQRFIKKHLQVDESHPQFQFILLTTYNAGPGTVRSAINRAKSQGAQNPYADFIKAEYMKPAIRSAIYKNQPHITEREIASKYKEISNYHDKVMATAHNIAEAKNTPFLNPATAHYTNRQPQSPKTHSWEEENSSLKAEEIQLDWNRIEKALTGEKIYINQPVGIRQTNNYTDVIIVKLLLQEKGYLQFDTADISKDIISAVTLNEESLTAIEKFQQEIAKLKKVDRIIDPQGKTFRALTKTAQSSDKKPIFIGDSIAHGFYNMSGGLGIFKGGAHPKKVLGFVQEAIATMDLKNHNIYLSTGLSNDKDLRYKAALEAQFAALQAQGIRAYVFGVSLNYPKINGEKLNKVLEDLCTQYNMHFLGGFKGGSTKDALHPRYFVLE